MKKILLIVLIISSISTYIYSYGKTKEIPKNVKVISQSCDKDSVYLTVIDLSNNEIVIFIHGESVLWNIIRTGMFVDPNKQLSFNGQDVNLDDDKK